MSLKDLHLRNAYDSDFDDILNDFYIPALSNSIKYKRLAGFFTSSSLAVAAKGLSKFISTGGYMKLICGAKLRKADVEAIREGYEKPARVIERMMMGDLGKLEDEFIRDHVRALGWMVANNKLEIKVAVVVDENGLPTDRENVEKQGIFHQKVGILEDSEGNKISFSGSDNETASAWQANIEEFKVFRGWKEYEKDYLDADLERFEKFWNGTSKRTKVVNIPTAIKDKLIEMAPDNIEELDLEKWSKRKAKEEKEKIKLRDYQKEAIKKWLENGKRGIFEMATGTGKTFTALGCFKRVLEDEKKLITVIACPYDHLVKQWLDDIKDFGISLDTIIADSSNPGWKNKLSDYLLDIKNGIAERLIVLTTHATLPSSDFMDIISTVDKKLLLIVDEVHGIGAPKRREGLVEDYRFRLGLSATPKRWADYEGTNEIFGYFGNTVFEFSLKKAINTVNPDTGETYLTPYEYKPYFVELTDDELLRYEMETEKLAKAYYRSKDKKEREELFTKLCVKRQKIITNATNKYTAFKEILDEMEPIKHCLVYCSPEQIGRVQDILNKKDVIQHKFTLHEGTQPEDKYGGLSEREFLLQKFAEGTYPALVAMRCLDEGVDVPPARNAIILASSGNPRQYIQRRGRVLRHFPGKEKAIIYDIIIVPTLSSSMNPEFFELERKILSKELRRYKEFAYIATNTMECLNRIEDIEEEYNLLI